MRMVVSGDVGQLSNTAHQSCAARFLEQIGGYPEMMNTLEEEK